MVSGLDTASNVSMVEMIGITKRFPGVLANDGVDFSLARGEVHSLLGENGAGKTTLMNILYGLYRSDKGEIYVRGEKARIESPRDSIKLGISMVHQQFELVDTLSVAENVALGLRARREPVLDLNAVADKLTELSKKYSLKVAPDSLIQELSVGEKQRVEILKALYRGATILILDEPTSVLTPQESEDLFKMVRSMASEGSSVVIITHKLPEVLSVSDGVTVKRKGKKVGTVETRSTNADELAYLMVGRQLSIGAPAPTSGGKVILRLDKVYAANRKGGMGLKGLNLALHEGEILGIAGVAGNGQNELVEILSGLTKVQKGSVFIGDEEVTNASPSKLIDEGVGVIPDDRKGSGLIAEFSVAENLVLEGRWNGEFAKKGIVDQGKVRVHAQEIVKEYSISTPDVASPAYTLSGGNLQRLLLAKVLSRAPRILVASQPTAGLDVGATQFIWDKLRSEKKRGVGVILISSDLAEVIALSDRIACIYDGTISGEMEVADADPKKLGLLMGGVRAS